MLRFVQDGMRHLLLASLLVLAFGCGGGEEEPSCDDYLACYVACADVDNSCYDGECAECDGCDTGKCPSLKACDACLSFREDTCRRLYDECLAICWETYDGAACQDP